MSPAAVDEMLSFGQGALTTLSLVAALFFLRYWRSTADRLFAYFAAAFLLFSASWAALAAKPSIGEHDAYVYLLRLAAFVAIMIGIIDKNRRA
jgi:hypothetical protein